MADLTQDNFQNEIFEPVENEGNLSEAENGTKLNENEKQEENLSKGNEVEKKLDDNHFQSIADKRLAELTQANMENERLKTELEALKAPKVQQKQEPVEPQQPSDYDPGDIYDKKSSTYKYEQDYKKYLRDMSIYNRELNADLKAQLDSEREKVQQNEMRTQAKAQTIGEFITRGRSTEEAQAIYNWATELLTDKGLTPERLMEFYDYENKQPSKTVQSKQNQFEQRKEREKMVLPPGIVGSEAEKGLTADEAFNDVTFKKSKAKSI